MFFAIRLFFSDEFGMRALNWEDYVWSLPGRYTYFVREVVLTLPMKYIFFEISVVPMVFKYALSCMLHCERWAFLKNSSRYIQQDMLWSFSVEKALWYASALYSKPYN